jgi:dihydroflavonol-4-reductase
MRVLVTGANDFIGMNVIHALCREGHEAHAFVRSAAANKADIGDLPVRFHTGDLGDRARLRKALRGMTAVIHCAGSTSPGEAGSRLRPRDVEGTRSVIEAAIDMGVVRLVHTSTTWTIAAQDDPDRRWEENSPPRRPGATSHFARTKADAETMVRAAIVRGLETLVLNPAQVIGAWDREPAGWGRLILAVAAGRTPKLPAGGASFCAASEVARAHVAALTSGRVGSRYILAGADATYDQLLEVIGCAVRVQSRRDGLTAATRVARGSGLLARADTADATERFGFPAVAGYHYFDSSRAIRELGYRSRTLAEIVGEAQVWYAERGLLPASATHPEAK